MFQAVRSSVELFDDAPGACVRLHEFADLTARSNGTGRTLGENDVADFIETRVGTRAVNVLAMVTACFL